MLLRAGTMLRGEIFISRAIHLRVEAGVTLPVKLRLQGGTSAVRGAGSSLQDSVYLWEHHPLASSSANRLAASSSQGVGVIEGLALSHFSENAVVVQGGNWKLVDCHISASRRTSRACTAITVKDGCARELRAVGWEKKRRRLAR